MGWHINNGADKLATFHPASRFRKSLYRPDIIKLLLRTGSVAKAVEVANRAKIVEKITVAKVLPPVVSIISPSTGQKLNQSKIQVRAEAHSVGKHTVQSMQLLLDGRPYRGKAGIHRIDSPSLGKVTHTWDVELSLGKHRIQVLADSEVSEGVSQTIDVSYAGEKINKTQKPTLYVLAIGISKAYPEKLRLNYAHKDATILTETLKKVSKNIFADVKTKLITEKQATRRGILQGLSWLRKEMTQRDVGIFFFAGHGDKDTDDSLYFLPSDVDSEDLLTTGLSAETIRRTLSATPGRLIALLDACHSGGFEEKAKRRGGTVTDDFVRDLIADETGLIVMCSSMGKEFSTENNEHRHGTFTVALLEGIQGNADSNKDGVIYLHELNSYVIDRVKKLSKGRQHPTTGKPTSIRSFPLAKP